MNELDQIDALGLELEAMVGRFHEEFDISPAAMVGVLTMVATRLSCEQFYEVDDEEDDF